jgi:ketosteroid isomerase-like protein
MGHAKRNLLLVLTTLLLVPVAGRSQTSSHSASSDAIALQQLRNLISDYAKSVDTVDLPLARKVWSQQSEVTFIHPRGTERGLEQVISNFYEKTMGLFSQRELQPDRADIHVYDDCAWSQFTWTFHATLKSNRQTITTQGRETQVYHKENGRWYIVHVHYSAMPDTAELRGF